MGVENQRGQRSKKQSQEKPNQPMQEVTIGKDLPHLFFPASPGCITQEALCGDDEGVVEIGQQRNDACHQHVDAIVRMPERLHDDACGVKRQNNVDECPDVLGQSVYDETRVTVHPGGSTGYVVGDNIRLV